MTEEEVYICWFEGQDEGAGKEIKAYSIQEAARTAVDIWRHENVEELGNDKLTVFVKDEDLKVHQVVVTQSGDSQAPEATM
jgi:hypothetical protein